MGKTESLLFGTRKRLKHVRDYNVFCDGTAIKNVHSVRYLGVKLDCNLSGESHAKELIGKCSGRVSFLFRYSQLLDVHTRRILCSALVQPLIDYCCSSWYSGLSSKLKQKLDVIQRRMARFVFSYGPRDHVGTDDFRKLSWMLISDRVNYFKLLHVFKIRHGMAPQYLVERFTSVEQTHQHNTRGRGRNFSISENISGSLVSFSYTAAKLWNDLPNSLKDIGSLSLFKKRVRECFMQSY